MQFGVYVSLDRKGVSEIRLSVTGIGTGFPIYNQELEFMILPSSCFSRCGQ